MTDENAELISSALRDIAAAIYRLGTAGASTPFGGLESLGMAIKESNHEISISLDNVASSILELEK